MRIYFLHRNAGLVENFDLMMAWIKKDILNFKCISSRKKAERN
jgi:hypothetical protein